MTHVSKASRHIAIAVAAAALLGAAALLLVSPTPASAARHPCPPSEFCLYFNEDANGGYYHYAGSDPNLDNDHYEGGDNGEIVGDTSRYAFNAGDEGRRTTSSSTGCPATGARTPASTRRLGHATQEVVEQHRVLPLGDDRSAGPRA